MHDSKPRNARLIQWITNFALLQFILFTAILVSLHLLKSDYNPVTRHLSEYAIGSWGWLMLLAFGIAGVASFSLANAIRLSIVDSLQLRVSWLLLYIAGSTEFVLAIFPTDLYLPDGSQKVSVSLNGIIHDLAGATHVLAIVTVTLLMTFALRKDVHWHSRIGTAAILAFVVAASAGLAIFAALLPIAVRGIVRWRLLAVTGVLLLMITVVAYRFIGQIPGSTVGLGQRFWVIASITWGMVFAMWLRTTNKLDEAAQ